MTDHHKQQTLVFQPEHLWFFDYLEAGGSPYNRPLFLRLSGNLNHQVLEQSLREILYRRHALNAGSGSAENLSVLEADNPLPLLPAAIDLSQLPDKERRDEMVRLITAEAGKPLDPVYGPFWHIMLFRLNENHFNLMVLLHYLISDAWSIGIFIRELAVLYETYSAD